jgi:hypothetical protein
MIYSITLIVLAKTIFLPIWSRIFHLQLVSYKDILFLAGLLDISCDLFRPADPAISWNSFVMNTNELSWMWVIIKLSHKVSMVLPCPSRGTLVSSRDHQLSTSCFNVTHSTRRFVIVKVAFGKWVESVDVFCTVHVSSLLVTILGPSIFGGLRETHVISTSTCMRIEFTSNTTWKLWMH